jgi:RNA recognition motif-containing protein
MNTQRFENEDISTSQDANTGIAALGPSVEYTECDQSVLHSSSAQKNTGTLNNDTKVSSVQSDNINRCNLIINYLPHDADDDSLHAMFIAHGNIKEAKVIREKNTKRSLGYGFVRYFREEDASAAIELMNGKIWNTKKIKVSFARPQSEDIKNCKLYVANLPKEMDESAVNSLFSKYGHIIECRVLRYSKDSSVSKGVAFVQFNLKSQANNALEMNGHIFKGQTAPLLVKYAEEQPYKGIDSLARVAEYMYIDGQPFLVGINHSDHSSYYISPSYSPSAPFHSPGYNYPAQTSLLNGAVYVAANSHQTVFTPPLVVHEAGVVADSFNQYPPRGDRNNNRKYFKQNSQSIPHINSGTVSLGYSNLPGVYSNVPKAPVHRNFAKRLPTPTPSCKVCIAVKNLPKDCNNGQLYCLFSSYGLVVSSHIQSADPETTPPTNVGTVIIQGMANAEYAVAALNGSIVVGGSTPLIVLISSVKQEV